MITATTVMNTATTGFLIHATTQTRTRLMMNIQTKRIVKMLATFGWTMETTVMTTATMMTTVTMETTTPYTMDAQFLLILMTATMNAG
jgi:hypothetical protein